MVGARWGCRRRLLVGTRALPDEGLDRGTGSSEEGSRGRGPPPQPPGGLELLAVSTSLYAAMTAGAVALGDITGERGGSSMCVEVIQPAPARSKAAQPTSARCATLLQAP